MPCFLLRKSARKSKRSPHRATDYTKLEPRAMMAVVISEIVASNGC